jgi:predicted nucleic acid-binding protein
MDAYLAAVADSCGLTLVTFDHGFASFPGVDALILT